MKNNLLEIKGLTVEIEGKEVLHDVNFSVGMGETIGLLGPNGSGKTSIAMTLMGHPKYAVKKGSIKFAGKDLLKMLPEERAKNGIFLSFQNPIEVPGVPFGKFLFTAYKEIKNPKATAKEFIELLKKKCDLLGIDRSFVDRSVNEGFSGGEKKRAEMLQLAVLEPKLAILDEIDSGLDKDGVKLVADEILKVSNSAPSMSIIIITHYDSFLSVIKPSRLLMVEKHSIRG